MSLVPAYKECTGPAGTGRTGRRSAFPSCSSPDLTSDFLTVGTPDANGKPAAFTGSVRYVGAGRQSRTPADEADVAVTVSLTDVRNQGDLTDYTGELAGDRVGDGSPTAPTVRRRTRRPPSRMFRFP